MRSASTSAWLSDSIHERLRLLLATLFGGGAIAALAAAWFFSLAAASAAYDRILISAAVQIAESVDTDRDKAIVNPPDSAFETLALAEDDRFFYAVRDPAGRLLTGDDRLNATGSVRSGGGTPQLHTESFDGARVRVATLDHFIASPGLRGWCRIIVAETRDARYRMALHLMERIGAIILTGSIAGFGLALIAVRRAFQPLERISHALNARTAHDLAPLDVESPRETARLVQAINDVMAKLSARLARLEAFTAVAAHQIRTPLTALAAQSELLASDRSAAARRDRIQRVQAHVGKLSRVTNQLLGQAMASYRAETAVRRPLDLVELTRGVAHDTIPYTLDRDLAFDIHAVPAVIEIMGDPVSLREAIANLVDNAIQHGAPTTMRIAIGLADGMARLDIADDGPGIAPALWEAVRHPFQVERTEREGAGMGLSIVDEIARAHGGSLDFESGEDGHFHTILILPALPMEGQRS